MQKNRDLIGKTIRIQENAWVVTKSLFDEDTQEDVLILRKKSAPKAKRNYPTTIFDLGYTNPDQLKVAYSDEEINGVVSMIETNQGQEIEIAMVTVSGLIENKNVILVGLSVADPKFYTIRASTGEFNSSHKISLELLIQSILLQGELKIAQNVYKNGSDQSGYDKAFASSKSKSNNDKRVKDMLEGLKAAIEGNTTKGSNPMDELNNLGDFGDLSKLSDTVNAMFNNPELKKGNMPPEFDQLFSSLDGLFKK